MRILLFGEYSRLHSMLKRGLEKQGHDVVVIGTGDGFKHLPTDITFKTGYKKGLALWINKLTYKLFGWDLNSKKVERQFFKQKEAFRNFDIVQLINTSPLGIQPSAEKRIIQYLSENNQHIFLLSCGADYFSVTNGLEERARYSIMSPYIEDTSLKKQYAYILKYVTPEFKKLHDFVVDISSGIIASDLDYHLPLANHPKYLGMAPNPIDTNEIEFIFPTIDKKVIIFHGINRGNYHKKGTHFFEEALQTIQEKYGDVIEVRTIENVPYKEYIRCFDDAHILLDQVLAYDQGFNALEGMAKGKVVFTGAEKEWLDYYKLEEDTVAINALPNSEAIAKKLSWLIENPEKIVVISKNARQFVEQHHEYKRVAMSYLKLWGTAMK